MDWPSVFNVALGAICGGSITGLGAYISLSKMVAIVDTKVQMMTNTCDDCRESVIAHHQNPYIHVTKDMRDRFERLENRTDAALNGRNHDRV